MDIKKKVGIALLIVGLIALVISVLADPIGIGRAPAFGGDQIAATVISAVAVLVGLYLTLRS